MSGEKIIIGSDHGGFELKENIKKILTGYEVKDIGCFSEESVDYPDIASELCKKVLEEKNSKGILICGTGIGMSIAANKFKGIRAALCHDEYTAEMSRKHNDANVLCLGGRILDIETAQDIVNTWLENNFEGGRHERRIKIIDGFS